jgi:hypothetical protein
LSEIPFGFPGQSSGPWWSSAFHSGRPCGLPLFVHSGRPVAERAVSCRGFAGTAVICIGTTRRLWVACGLQPFFLCSLREHRRVTEPCLTPKEISRRQHSANVLTNSRGTVARLVTHSETLVKTHCGPQPDVAWTNRRSNSPPNLCVDPHRYQNRRPKSWTCW